MRWSDGITKEHELEQAPGDNGQESLVCCSSQDCRVGHDLATEQQPHVRYSFKHFIYIFSLYLYINPVK